MKAPIKLFLAFVFVAASLVTANAQKQTRKERRAAKAEAVKKMVDESNYVFVANSASPLGGGLRQLTSEYDLKITKDTITAWLPYFGVAHIAPIDPTEGGIKFTTTNFEYTTTRVKNGNWRILIKPRDKNIGDMRDVQQMWLTISENGYASLQVISTNRDPIMFDGELQMKSL
jgi:hypothetical protein